MGPSKIAEDAINLFIHELEARGIRLDSRLTAEPIGMTVDKARASAITSLQEGTAELDENWPGMRLEIRWEPLDSDNELARTLISKSLALRFSRGEILDGVVPVTHVGRWLIAKDRITPRRDHAED